MKRPMLPPESRNLSKLDLYATLAGHWLRDRLLANRRTQYTRHIETASTCPRRKLDDMRRISSGGYSCFELSIHSSQTSGYRHILGLDVRNVHIHQTSTAKGTTMTDDHFHPPRLRFKNSTMGGMSRVRPVGMISVSHHHMIDPGFLTLAKL